MQNAIQREKQLKGWRREKKIWLIESVNPNWHDLSDGWYGNPPANALSLDSVPAKGVGTPLGMTTRKGLQGRGPLVEKRERDWNKKISKLKAQSGLLESK